jgi:hypothetical protein
MMGDTELIAAPIELITPAYGEPIDNIVKQAYNSNSISTQLIAAIQDPDIKKWPKALCKEVRIPIVTRGYKQ